jgi:hypothetical protein
MDSAYVASTGDDNICRVWGIEKRESLAQLQREKVCQTFMDIEQLDFQHAYYTSLFFLYMLEDRRGSLLQHHYGTF